MKQITILKNGRKRVQTINKEPSITDQSYKKECDVNHIINKFMKTGQITHLARQSGIYADVSNITDLQDSLSKIQLAQEALGSLPAKLRDRFQNDPQKMIDFINDPKNTEECIQYGLKTRTQVSEETNGTSGGTPKKSVKKDAKNESATKNDPSADA